MTRTLLLFAPGPRRWSMNPTAETVDVARLLDGGAWTAYQKLLTALAALAIIFDGFDIQILGFAIPSLIREWHVERSDFGPVLAVGLAGMVVGGPLAGYCGDRFGRRVALIGCVVFLAWPRLDGVCPWICGTHRIAVHNRPRHWRRRAERQHAGCRICTPEAASGSSEAHTGMCAARRHAGRSACGADTARFGVARAIRHRGSLPLLFAFVLWAVLPESAAFLGTRPALWPQLCSPADPHGPHHTGGSRV